jgi:hypothetical protein
LAASERILIPTTDDQLHRNNFEYMFALVYGFSQPSAVYYYYRHLSFYYRANQHDVKLPQIQLIINKLINKDNSTTTSTAQLTLKTNESEQSKGSNLEWEFIYDLYKKHAHVFYNKKANDIINTNNSNRLLASYNSFMPKTTQQQSCPLPPQFDTINDFKKAFVIDICERITTNQIVRQAVRCHSPLPTIRHLKMNPSTNNGLAMSPNLSIRTSRNNNNNNTGNNLFLSATNLSTGGGSLQITTPNMSVKSRAGSVSNKPSAIDIALIKKKKKSIASTPTSPNAGRHVILNGPVSVSTSQYKSEVSISSNNSESSMMSPMGNENLDNNDAIAFDTILDKIVDILVNE